MVKSIFGFIGASALVVAVAFMMIHTIDTYGKSNSNRAVLNSPSYVSQADMSTEKESDQTAPQIVEPVRTITQSPELIRIQELEGQLVEEKDYSSKLRVNLEEGRVEISALESDLEKLRLIVCHWGLEVLMNRPDWNDIRDTVSSPGSEIEAEKLKAGLIGLSTRWPIDWSSVSSFDLERIAVAFVRFEEASKAIRDEWNTYHDASLGSPEDREKSWRENRIRLFKVKEGFLSGLRAMRGEDEVGLLDL